MSSGLDIVFCSGHTGGDEMCNLYLMFYTVSPEDDFVVCVDEQNPGLTSQLPPGSDVPLPPNPELEHEAAGTGELPQNFDNGQPDAQPGQPVKRPRPANGDYDYSSPSLTDLADDPDSNTELDGVMEPRSVQYTPRCVRPI